MTTPQPQADPADYLTYAGNLLQNALAGYEVYYGAMATGGAASLADRRVEIAAEFAKLAAIQRGLIPPEWLPDIVRDATGRLQQGKPAGSGR